MIRKEEGFNLTEEMALFWELKKMEMDWTGGPETDSGSLSCHSVGFRLTSSLVRQNGVRLMGRLEIGRLTRGLPMGRASGKVEGLWVRRKDEIQRYEERLRVVRYKKCGIPDLQSSFD